VPCLYNSRRPTSGKVHFTTIHRNRQAFPSRERLERRYPTLYKDLERFSAFLGLERGALRGDGARATLSSVQTRFVLLGKEWVAEPLAYLAG
jgi:hypothetical protein